jgi:Alpha amylase, catalytic domain/Secretion system C-terminal sorting domain
MRQVIFSALVYFISAMTARSQIITLTPSLPTDLDSVKIIFDATQGDAGLKGYTGNDVYAYTGVLTNLSTSNSNWRYVKESTWLQNLPSCLMTRIAKDKYQLVISPSIRSFYSVPVNEQILKMAFVFRNSTGSVSGRGVGGADIFTDVYAQGLNVSFINPASKFSLVSNNQKIQINISASANDSICLFLDNMKIKSVAGNSLTDSVYASGTNLHSLISIAYKIPNSVADTVSYMVFGTPQKAPLPAGVHDGINYIDDNTVTFVLFAPFKNNIYLIGDFNNWTPDNSTNLMYCDSNDTTRYWLTVNNLVKGKEYIFQYLIDGNIRIADPYCEKISDPSNDQYIPASIYPNLISYPVGKTTGIAGVIQTGQTPYNWQVINFIPPDKNKLVIYELLIRDFTANRDIKTVTDSLAYLKRLGVNAIELMPFNEFDGNDSWGYNPCFYFAPDKAYGTREDYKRFIDACHANGMAVIQDMVLDFSTNNSPLVQMYFANGNPTVQNPWYDVTSPNTVYVFGNVFNHNSPYTRRLTDSITSFWMSQYKVDGFRFDFAKGWTNTVGEGSAYDASRIYNLELAANHIWSVNPNAYVILELFTANTEENELSNYGMMIWDNMNCNYNQASMGYATGPCNWDLGGVSYQNLQWGKANAIGYMESHDEERLMYKNLTYGNSSGNYSVKDLHTALRRMEMTSSFLYTVPGPKMLWQFGELGYDISIDSGGRTSDKPILWEYYNDYYRNRLYKVTSYLIKLKENEPIFSTSTFSMDVSNPVKQITLTDGSNEVHVAGNFDVVSNSITIHFNSIGTWYDYFNSDSINITVNDYTMTMMPGDYRLFSNRKLSGFGTNIADKVTLVSVESNLSIYPNPASDQITINYPMQNAIVDILALDGKVILTQNLSANKQIDVSGLNRGMYFLRIHSGKDENRITRFIKL